MIDRKAQEEFYQTKLEGLRNGAVLLVPPSLRLIPFVVKIQFAIIADYIVYNGRSVHPFEDEFLRECGGPVSTKRFKRICKKWYKWQIKNQVLPTKAST
jgi:hypothetical protein